MAGCLKTLGLKMEQQRLRVVGACEAPGSGVAHVAERARGLSGGPLVELSSAPLDLTDMCSALGFLWARYNRTTASEWTS